MFFVSFPDWHENINDIIAEEDNVWVYFKATGTNTGKYHGLNPTYKKITITAVQMWRLVEEKVIEKQSVADELEAFKQVGVIEYKGFPDDVS